MRLTIKGFYMIGYFLQVQLFQRNNAFVMHRCNMLLRKKITTIKKAPQVVW